MFRTLLLRLRACRHPIRALLAARLAMPAVEVAVSLRAAQP